MIRAFLLRLLGFAPVWEVRSVSMKSGKDIPGERKFKGGYTGARRYFKEHPAPPDHELRLQAILVTRSTITPREEHEELPAMWKAALAESRVTAGELLSRMPRGLYEKASAAALAVAAGTATEAEREILREGISAAREAGAGAVPEVRGSGEPDAPRGLQQAAGSDVAMPAVSSEDPRGTPGIDDLEEPEQDHECDAEGPLEWDETGGAYVPTCSVCGRLN